MRAPNEPTPSRRTLGETADGDLSISTLLVLLGIGTIVPVLLFSAFVIYSFGAAEQGRYELRVSVAAHEAQAAVDRELKGKLGALQTLATSPLFTPESPSAIYEQAKQVAEYLGSSVVIFDAASRKQMLNTRISYGTQLPDRPDPNVGKVTDSGKPIISDLLIDQFGEHFSFAIYVPVIRDGSVTAVIASSFDPTLMAQVLQEDVQSADWVASIIDRNGVILARSKDYWSIVGKRSPSGVFERGAGGELTIARTRDFEGKLALVGFSHSSVAGWVIATSVPLEIIEAPLRRSWIIFGIAGLSFLTLSAVFAFLLGRHLTRPVSTIVQAAAGLGRGELVLSISSALREINVISRALSRASIERKSAEEHIGLLMREQAHRNKNLLTVVQSIARLTARYSTDFHAFESAFSARIGGLACSNDLLVSRQWVGTDPASLVRSQLAPFTELDGFRVKMDGPSVMLKPEATEALGLALHELATNAVKYGALSVPHGSVSIKWQHEPERFSMSWSEHDGPPVTPPLSKGFGRVVIEQMAAQSLSASVSLEFPREGVHWTIHMPVSVIQKGDGPIPVVLHPPESKDRRVRRGTR
jgi:two-component sensor histidine kinase